MPHLQVAHRGKQCTWSFQTTLCTPGPVKMRKTYEVLGGHHCRRYNGHLFSICLRHTVCEPTRCGPSVQAGLPLPDDPLSRHLHCRPAKQAW